MAKLLYISFIILLEIVLSFTEQDVVDTSRIKDFKGSSRVLSRKKRYLIFPDGSSFQLVFCTQTHGYLQVGDIVWFGTTAALAWELPTDPKLFKFFKKHDKLHETAENRDGASKHVYYLDENGKILSKVPYKKRLLVNPAFAKRSLDNGNEKEEFKNLSVKELHEKRKDVNIFESLDKDEIEFHREGRKSLYIQLEKYIKALGWSGRECVLRFLCEQGKVITGQNTFLGEIIRATFTLPRGREFVADEHREYDAAHKAGNCVDLYPKCKQSRE